VIFLPGVTNGHTGPRSMSGSADVPASFRAEDRAIDCRAGDTDEHIPITPTLTSASTLDPAQARCDDNRDPSGSGSSRNRAYFI
jgi:hypothetical protein